MKKKDIELVFKGADKQSWKELLDDIRPKGERAERALEIIDRLRTDGHINNKEQGCLRRAILLPERPQGEWINREAVSNTLFPFWERYECNKCHKYNGYSNFCPNCGADMRGGTE